MRSKVSFILKKLFSIKIYFSREKMVKIENQPTQELILTRRSQTWYQTLSSN